jgi:cytosine/adenosine deaminase-related metal-dependent hydrolase
MCKLCDEGKPQDHSVSQLGRRDFLKASAATGVAAAGASLFAASPARAADGDVPPLDSGKAGRRYIIRGGSVMSMDPKLGDFARADVLVEGKKIQKVGPNLSAGGADVIDATGRIVMPGFIDTHHHQFETALRSFLANGILINDGSGSPSADPTYYEYILLKFAPVYRPQDVYISELFGGLAQLDDGVTTVHDISQIHHSPAHSDAAIQALFDTGRRAALGYFESAGGVAGNQYPSDAFRIKKQWFSASDQLVHMIMGGEVYLGEPTYSEAWRIGRQLELQIAAHILSPFGIRPILDDLAAGTGGVNNDIGLGPDNLFIHMTGMSDFGWQKVKEKGVQVSIAFPIEMNMRHGKPPILKMQELGMEPSLSSDVEVTMTADFFTQMRSAMTMQRMVVNQMILEQGTFEYPNQWPTPAPGTPALLNVRDVLRFATLNGAKHLRLDGKTGSLTPGKEADILILDATALNVAPLNNVPGAVVSLMDRTNVETVIVAGKVRKWKGKLLDVDLPYLRRQLEDSRDYLFGAAGVPQNLFRST